MVQLIDKAAVVAEIERMLEAIANVSEQDVKDGDLGVIYAGQLLVLRNLVKFLDTLEVKEVDLEKEIEQNKKVYTVWVGGIEINDHLLTNEEASTIARKYIEDGYNDVVVKKGE